MSRNWSEYNQMLVKKAGKEEKRKGLQKGGLIAVFLKKLIKAPQFILRPKVNT